MEKLGKFELREQIGRGAMAEVYKGWDPSMKRWVAVKKMKSEFAENLEQLDRFIDEAVTAGNLEHPNIVTIFEFGKEGDRPFIAMAYLEGGSLDKLIQSRAVLPLSQRVGYVVHVCRALEYAHRQRVFHRDIKPSNVMLTVDGIVKVVDFGIARLGDSTKTQTGTVMGTLGYMSPQLIEGKGADAKSDIWAVGVMFYELLALQRPFNGDNPAALMANIQSQLIPSILEAAPGTPLDLAATIERMLRKGTSERFQSMEEVLIELEPIWRRLQETEVANLVAVSKQLFEVRDLVGAQNAAIKALQIDTANIEAKTILDKIKTEFRRKEILPKVEAHVEKGQNLLVLGQLEKARAQAEAALELDSSSMLAHELLGQVEIAAEKARDLQRDLRIGKQRLAEGAYTEAEIQLTKVLESDPANAAAQELLKQIRAEKARRDRQKRLSDLLRRARVLLTDIQYDECIQLLVDAKGEFPGEGQIDKLLETARQDKAEQERQTLLNEARNLLRAEKFEEALKSLEDVLVRFPADNSAKNLYRLVLQGQEQQIRDRQFQNELASLRALIKEGKYTEAIARGEQLFEAFPDEFQLADLIAYARTENAHQEVRRRQEQQLEQVNQEIQSGRFREAIQAAESALKESPENADLVALLGRAKALRAERERRDLRQKRLSEIKALIGRGDLAGAVELARQTLQAVGPDTEIRQLQLQAEEEYEQLEKKRRMQQEILDEARGLFGAGKLGEAAKVLQQGVEASVLSETDTRVGVLRREIEEKRIQQERAERERQRQLSETLRRARTLWTGLRYRECIELLQEAQKEFSGETEIVKLLEIARHEEGEREKAERQKQGQLGEARKLIVGRQYEEALGILDQVLHQWPTEAAAKELQGAAQQGRQEQNRERQLKEDLASLKRMVDEARYQEAIAKGEKLRQGHPRDVQIPKLLAEARSGQARIERKQQLDQWNEKIEIEIKNGRFRDAIKAAEAALKEFPQNQGLATSLGRARAQQAEKGKRELLDKKIEEIKTKISKDDLAGAAKLALRTLEEVGPDAEIGRLLQSAKSELEQREQKKRDQEETLQSAWSLFRAGSLGDATKILDRSVQTGLFSASDQRLAEIRRDIERRQARLSAEEQKQSNAKKTRQPQKVAESKVLEEQTRAFTVDNATIIVHPSAPYATTADRSLPAPEVELPAVSESVPPAVVEESPRAPWKNSIAIGALAVVVIGGIASFIYFRFRRPPPPPETASELKVEHDLMNGADQLVAGSPRRFADSLAKYQKLADMHKSLEGEARGKIQRIQELQRQENEWMEKGKVAQDLAHYDDALKDYENAGQLNGDHEKDAEADISTVNGLKKGMTIADIAQKNFKQAEDYYAQKQWERAESLYRIVKETKDAPSALRSSSAEKEASASTHVTEEALFSQANSTRPLDAAGAKVLYQKVIDMKLDHQQEAAKAIQEIDAEIAGAEHVRFLSNLSNQIRALIDQGNAQSLQEAKQKYQDFESSGGQDTMGLRAGISALETKLREEKEELSRFLDAEADFKNAVARKDVDALKGKISEEFRSIEDGRGAHAALAREYVGKTIPDAISALTPKELPAQPTDDRTLIAGVLERYRNAYNGRRAADIQAIWPGISKEEIGKDVRTFRNASMIDYRLKYDKSSFQVSGDGGSATAGADYAVSMTQLGQTQNASGKVVFNLRKLNNRWYIVSLQ